jgi:hypothetical protein
MKEFEKVQVKERGPLLIQYIVEEIFHFIKEVEQYVRGRR